MVITSCRSVDQTQDDERTVVDLYSDSFMTYTIEGPGEEHYSVIEVFYATDRNTTGDTIPAKVFGGRRGAPHSANRL